MTLRRLRTQGGQNVHLLEQPTRADGSRGPHNLWSQVQFQAALEKEGKIFKVKFSPQAEKDE